MAQEMLREAIKKRRMMHASGMMHSAATENAEAPEHAKTDLPKSPIHMGADNAEHEDDGIMDHKMPNPGKEMVSDGTVHVTEGEHPSPVDEDGDDDMAMIKHMTQGMNDADMEHAVKSKPKTLGERMRQHAVVKASQMKHK